MPKLVQHQWIDTLIRRSHDTVATRFDGIFINTFWRIIIFVL